MQIVNTLSLRTPSLLHTAYRQQLQEQEQITTKKKPTSIKAKKRQKNYIEFGSTKSLLQNATKLHPKNNDT